MKFVVLVAVLLSVTLLAGCRPQSQYDSESQFVTAGQPMTEINSEPSAETSDLSGEYVPYDSAYVTQAAKNGKAVLFFHASSCPTCREVDKDLQENASQIPLNLTIFKTDYDTEQELKQRYEVTYQHTFVQVDEHGNEVAKWNGGGLEEITQNVQ